MTQPGRFAAKNSVTSAGEGSLLEKVRRLLSNAQLDKSFWAEAIVYASHLINGLH